MPTNRSTTPVLLTLLASLWGGTGQASSERLDLPEVVHKDELPGMAFELPESGLTATVSEADLRSIGGSGCGMDPAELAERIDQQVLAMLEAGDLDEPSDDGSTTRIKITVQLEYFLGLCVGPGKGCTLTITIDLGKKS